MAATATDYHVLYVRIPREMEEQLRRVADREANGISAVTRRLLTAGLAREQQTDSIIAR